MGSCGSTNSVQASGRWPPTGVASGGWPSATSCSLHYPPISLGGDVSMPSRSRSRIAAIGLALVAVAGGTYALSRPQPAAPVVGVVRSTEIRVAPEVGGQLAEIKVRKGDHVRAGDVVAELSALELSAAVQQARASLGSAIASREH